MSIGGSAPSKYCDLRSSRFSLYDRLSPSPQEQLDCHLVHTVIPGAPSIANSLGVFLGSAGYSLASFAGVLSDGRRSVSLAGENMT